jgi:hypothetical protein
MSMLQVVPVGSSPLTRQTSLKGKSSKVFAKLFATFSPGGKHLWRTQDDT